MLYIGTKKQIQEYRDSPAINQSTLKDLQYGLVNFLKKQSEEGPTASFEKGSAVDCLLTAEKGTFEEQFYVSAMEKKPSDTEMAIVQMTFNKLNSNFEKDISLEKCSVALQEAIETIGWQPNWKMETRVDKISNNPLCQEYFQDLKNSQGKTVLSQNQFEQVLNTVKSLRENPTTAQYFNREELENNKDIVVLYQVPVYFKHQGQDCKALPDIVIFSLDAEKRRKIQIIDLKTMSGDTLEFFSSVTSFRYDIQIAFYIEAYRNVDKSFFEKLEIDLTDDTYFFPSFIVESIDRPGTPLIYQVDSSLIDQGKYGSEDVVYTGRIIKKGKKGYDALISELIYYQNNEFKQDIILNNRNGNLVIGVDGII